MRGSGKPLIVALALLGAACVRVGHIQQQAPIRTLNFTGSHQALARCVHQRLGGQIRDEFGEKYVIYDSAKGRQAEGLTHWSVTVARDGAERGLAELRVVRPERAPGPSTPPPPRLTSETIDSYWGPVRQCAAQAKG